MSLPAINRSAAAFICRNLARTSAKAYLCTIGAESQPDTASWPSASLITVAAAWDGSPVLLLSELAHHTQNILADARATILYDGSAGFANPQQGPRAAFMGRLKSANDARLGERFLGRHPEARMYAGFPDFNFYRMAVERVHYVGGFGRAVWLKGRSVTLAAGECRAVAEIEAGALEHMNREHADAVANYGKRLIGARGKHWRMIALDPEGCDLACGNGVHRLDFERRITGAAELRTHLAELAKRARRTPPKRRNK
ncbi:MAG: DUF2470 domain-containing protein [Rhodospirillales bacterium]|jgi:hypothetical protein|nr:heme iron utilization protein [Rhodospirillaceae bacterium]MDP6430118.1 DUF2470 domain-containing protein [Rhodospirillales bacterium]MDP6645818.1 DUF2470 domain-containing protein [Rhodospirillales bacterium]MDP6842383.1 DUF2470 domain-containing protein [Rhodospirillales bacterium]